MQDSTIKANGKVYRIENQFSLARFMKYEELELEVGFGKTFSEIYDICHAAMKDINAHKQGEAYVKLYNLVYGMKNADNKKPFVLRYCALFINEEDEDRAVITEDMIDAKIEDWTKEGLNYELFFQLAIASLPGFRDRYKKLMESISTDQGIEIEEGS